MLKLSPFSIMAVVTAHSDECPKCSQMEPCETGQRLVRWSVQKLAELMAPIPEESKRE